MITRTPDSPNSPQLLSPLYDLGRIGSTHHIRSNEHTYSDFKRQKTLAI